MILRRMRNRGQTIYGSGWAVVGTEKLLLMPFMMGRWLNCNWTRFKEMALQVRYSLRIALGKAGEVCMVRPVPVLGIPINSGVNVWMGGRRCRI